MTRQKAVSVAWVATVFALTLGGTWCSVRAIAGSSMEPTLRDGALVLVAPARRPWRAARRGDVVIARLAQDQPVVVKRIAGVPGDCIAQGAFVTARPVAPGTKPCVMVRAGRYFLSGDNPAESIDSRQAGQVAAADVIGRVMYVLWPPSLFGSMPN